MLFTMTTDKSEQLVYLLSTNSWFFPSPCLLPDLFQWPLGPILTQCPMGQPQSFCMHFTSQTACVCNHFVPFQAQSIPQNHLCVNNRGTGTKSSVTGIGIAAALFYSIYVGFLYCFLMYSLLQQITDSPWAIHTCYPNLFSWNKITPHDWDQGTQLFLARSPGIRNFSVNGHIYQWEMKSSLWNEF